MCKKIYLPRFDYKNAIGPVTHDVLNKNMNKAGITGPLIEIIMGSYKKATVRLWNQQKAVDIIAIRK
jgi:hypothetical protein